MLGFGRKNDSTVIDLHPAEVNIGPDATVLDLKPKLKQRNRKDTWEKADIFGSLVASLSAINVHGYSTTPDGKEINFHRRRVIAGVSTSVAVIAVTASLFGISSQHDSETSAPVNSYLSPDFKQVDGTEAAHDRVVEVSANDTQATYYEEKGGLLCRFSGVETYAATVTSSPSDVVTHTTGDGFELEYGSDCYQSATIYVNKLNPQGFVASVHDRGTYDGNQPNILRFPEEVQREVVR